MQQTEKNHNLLKQKLLFKKYVKPKQSMSVVEFKINFLKMIYNKLAK